MRVAIYRRVSTTEQGNSLKAQLAMLNEYVKGHDWELVGDYVDDGYSGGSDQRPGLESLLRDAEAHLFNTLIVTKLDRFFRSIRLLLDYLERLDKLGTAFISTSEGLDTSSPMGKFTLHILAGC
jgi:site-specific DNA recombinase